MSADVIRIDARVRPRAEPKPTTPIGQSLARKCALLAACRPGARIVVERLIDDLLDEHDPGWRKGGAS